MDFNAGQEWNKNWTLEIPKFIRKKKLHIMLERKYAKLKEKKSLKVLEPILDDNSQQNI